MKQSLKVLLVVLTWALLRFLLMPEVRKFIIEQFHLTGSSAVLLSHSLIVLEGLSLLMVYQLLLSAPEKKEIHIDLSSRSAIRSGFLYGIFIFLISVPVAFYFGMSFSPHFSAVEMVGNIFSNGAEEIIYRFILFSSFLVLFRKDSIGIGMSAIAFGVAHWDLPLLFQAYIMIVGAILGISYSKTQNIAVPYLAHMVADILLDSLFR